MSAKRKPRRPGLWLLWLAAMALLAVWLADRMHGPDDRRLFLPGRTSDGHHQIELACTACHGKAFTDRDAMQSACESCHLDQLKEAKDDHPKTKFTDPRNADRVAQLDARYCVTCHVEHRPELTLTMGLTQPVDYCFVCHADIAVDRPSHADFGFDTCASAGCHNFHDNRALYEDFLLKHADAPDLRARIKQPATANLSEIAALGIGYPLDQYPLRALSRNAIDAPAAQRKRAIEDDWLASQHAAAGANCSACHGGGEDAGENAKAWQDHPTHEACATCHGAEVDSFLRGKHGMRLDRTALGMALPALSPADARLPMQNAALTASLGCSTCHAAHRYDTDKAATTACLSCHADEHSLAFEASPHARVDLDMSCASCHMPMVERDVLDGAMSWTHANHNQSDNLRPNEKMLRPVCLQCHGLGFAIDALADAALVARNFAGRPTQTIASIRMAVERLAAIRAERAAAKRAAPGAAPPDPSFPDTTSQGASP